MGGKNLILRSHFGVSNLEWPVPITNSFALLRARWDDSSLLALPTDCTVDYLKTHYIRMHKMGNARNFS